MGDAHKRFIFMLRRFSFFFLLRIDFNEEDDFRISTTLWSDYMDHIE